MNPTVPVAASAEGCSLMFKILYESIFALRVEVRVHFTERYVSEYFLPSEAHFWFCLLKAVSLRFQRAMLKMNAPVVSYRSHVVEVTVSNRETTTQRKI